jgi:hypothetical protein
MKGLKGNWSTWGLRFSVGSKKVKEAVLYDFDGPRAAIFAILSALFLFLLLGGF